MLQALLVTFREGLESFLIVGVVTAYLRRAGRTDLLVGVRAGLIASVVTCAVGAWLWQMVPNQPLYEGIAALVAAALVGLLLWQMIRVGRHVRREIEARVARAIHGNNSTENGSNGGAATTKEILPAGAFGIAVVTTLLVTREGLEALLYLGIQTRMAGTAVGSLIGAAVGLVLAGWLAWGWARFIPKLKIAVVLKVTAVFLALFLVQLLVFGIHELAESGVISGSERFHDATEVVGPDGWIGHLLSYSLLAAPLLYLFWSRRSQPPPPRATAT